MTSFRLSGTLLAVAALLPVVLAAPASAEPTSSTVRLTIETSEGWYRTVRLHCDPPGGSHPDPWTACDEIDAANGDFDQLEQQLIACTMELRPVSATARGRWAGEPVLWYQEFSNPCTMRAATGTVFDF